MEEFDVCQLWPGTRQEDSNWAYSEPLAIVVDRVVEAVRFRETLARGLSVRRRERERRQHADGEDGRSQRP